MESVRVDIAILGAGTVGLALAEAVSRKLPGVEAVVIERHAGLGQEISSRHSEVVHAGIY